jgi:branched-chain amino acid transport system substrate-binding protein
MQKIVRTVAALMAIAVCWLTLGPARAADPIKVGFSMALTGSVAQNGKQLIIALELWRDDVNAHGGLLGRPVELVYYDDQSNPTNVPGIYTKLITVDKVDLLLGPYATNMVAAAMPVIMQHNMTTISILAIDVNRHFHYARYFDMIPVGAGRNHGVLARLLRTRRGAEAEAANRRDRRRRC